MLRTSAILIVLFLAGSLALVGVKLDLSWLSRLALFQQNDTKPASTVTSQIAERTSATSESEAPSFDIARVEAGGSSVFAGRAAPNAEVTILANGEPIATARANENGEWSAVTDRRIASGPAQLSLSATVPGRAMAISGQTVAVDVAPASRQAPVRVASLSAMSLTGPAKPEPITFMFREAVMTPEGRLAASKLAHYLRSQNIALITLSGHADERGSDQTNIDLSKDRLDAVARALRQGGYTGKLVLMPKGKSEPYMGVDRKATPKDVLFQLDRRVELRSQ